MWSEQMAFGKKRIKKYKDSDVIKDLTNEAADVLREHGLAELANFKETSSPDSVSRNDQMDQRLTGKKAASDSCG